VNLNATNIASVGPMECGGGRRCQRLGLPVLRVCDSTASFHARRFAVAATCAVGTVATAAWYLDIPNGTEAVAMLDSVLTICVMRLF